MRRLLIGVVTVLAVLLAGCSTRSDSKNAGAEETAPATAGASPMAGGRDFGTLKDVCGRGEAGAGGAQGVTANDIKTGVFTDVGWNKIPDFVDAAKVFTSWCNDNGGINGRKLTPVIHDAGMEVRQRMQQACKEDFALVGGAAGLDGLGAKDRVNCLLPAFAAQSSMAPAVGSDLQVIASGPYADYFSYAGLYKWLLTEKYPASAKDVGIISGDSPVTKTMSEQFKESIAQLGGKVSYTELYPATGVSDWTAYAQSIKNKKVKGLVFLGDFGSLAKLEQSLSSLDYTLDWVDSNSNSYGAPFLKLAGAALGTQHNYAELFGTHPLETSSPAVDRIKQLYAKYAPDASVSYLSLRAFSAWLLFATSARDCAELTRKCVYDNATKITDWTAGGIQAPFDLSHSHQPGKCYSIVEATPKGWKPADFEPDDGAYRCDAPTLKYKGKYTKPVTLADVGKSMSNLK